MKFDPGIYIDMHSVLSLKPGVTLLYQKNYACGTNSTVWQLLRCACKVCMHISFYQLCDPTSMLCIKQTLFGS